MKTKFPTKAEIKSAINIAEDHALVKEIKTGDQMAFNKLYEKYKNSINNFIMKLTKGNVELSKDLSSEVFAKVYESINRFNPSKGAVSTWMFTMARNKYIDFLRCNKHEIISIEALVSENADEEELRFQIVSDTKTPFQELAIKQRNESIHSVIEKIEAENLRTIIKLRFMDELSYEELVIELGIPMGSVKAMIHRAKSALKALMLEEKILA